MQIDLHNEHVAIGVAFIVLALGGLAVICGASDTVGLVAGLVAFFGGLALSMALNERDYRRRKRARSGTEG